MRDCVLPLRSLLFFYRSTMLKIDRLGEYEIQYDTIIDHDAYQFLRISLEVPRDNKTTAIVVLNGKNIGVIRSIAQGKKTLFIGYRLINNQEILISHPPAKAIGKIAAAIISDFVQ
jgi:hypothetical protein